MGRAAYLRADGGPPTLAYRRITARITVYSERVDLGEPIREHQVLPAEEPVPTSEPTEQPAVEPMPVEPVEVPA